MDLFAKIVDLFTEIVDLFAEIADLFSKRVVLQNPPWLWACCREFIYTNKLPYRDQLQTSNPVESSATDKSLYSLYNVQLQVGTLKRIQLQTCHRVEQPKNHTVKSSAIQTSYSVERSARNKRELS